MSVENETMKVEEGGDSSSDGNVFLIVVLLAVTIPAAFFVNSSAPDGYMDEEFHFGQVQAYCRGDFAHWDPKITTFPGLYVASLVYIEVLLPGANFFGYANAISDLCNPAVLRSLNVFFLAVCALLFREIALLLDPDRNGLRASSKALVLSLYPLHWFYTLLYYTELGSATAVMAMYLSSLKRAYWSSAFFGALAILFRQTNAVWILFVLCVGILDFLGNVNGNSDPRLKRDDSSAGSAGVYENEELLVKSENARKEGVRQRSHSNSGSSGSGSGHGAAKTSDRAVNPKPCDDIIQDVCSLLKRAWVRKREVLWNFTPFLLVILAFVCFVVKNGSIVVGDKNAHKLSPHFAQILYCGIVCAALQASIHFNPRRIAYLLSVLKRESGGKPGILVLLAAALSLLAVHYGVPHPYLLADNRHYSFYLWKDVIQRHWTVKYLAVPFYVYSWSSILSLLAEKQKRLWIVAFFLAALGVLVPSPLLEFRYYNIPFYFIFLHSSTSASGNSKNSGAPYFFTPVQFLFVNFVTVLIFHTWPFEWSSQPGVLQRFMW